MERKLSEIEVQKRCAVSRVMGENKLRLFGLGFFEGSEIVPMYENRGGSTRIYYVKDCLIALRKQDGEQILAKEEMT
ncbi:FeoA family protein [Chakrabartyella piscis]|uniref:FeoA family protein n=1 Tax=Chakrabartyella piscis TaxID=2918914 RepID=UPI002958A170|nr:FeoA family protein [Chakrabartyella piscis]